MSETLCRCREREKDAGQFFVGFDDAVSGREFQPTSVEYVRGYREGSMLAALLPRDGAA